MAPKRRRGGKGKKGKKKGGKKKKKVKVIPQPPPLHLLTELYKKLDEETKMLYEMRIAARRKRIECHFMMREILNAKGDNERYRDIVEENIEFLRRAMEKLRKLLQAERDAINDAIRKQLEEYERRRLEAERRISLMEEELANTMLQLEEFRVMINELERLLAELDRLQKEIEAAQLEANVKIRHLTNQFLNERGKLHNHLEEQLFSLVKHLRSYIMPILWNFMQNMIRGNLCARRTLAHTDERYIALAERRDQLVLKRKLLILEKPYWNIDWTFQKLDEMDTEKKRRKKAAREFFKFRLAQTAGISLDKKTKETMKKIPLKSRSGYAIAASSAVGLIQKATRIEKPSIATQLGKDFNTYLVQRLTAAKEAQERAARAKRLEEKRFLKQVLEEAKKGPQYTRELLEDIDSDEDEEEEEREEEQEWMEDFEWGGEEESSEEDEWEDIDEDLEHEEGEEEEHDDNWGSDSSGSGTDDDDDNDMD